MIGEIEVTGLPATRNAIAPQGHPVFAIDLSGDRGRKSH